MTYTIAYFKSCCRCGVSKPVDDFHINNAKKDGRSPACSDCVSKRQAELYRSNPKRRKNTRKNNLKRLYGMTLAEWEQRYEQQNGLCASCGHPPLPNKSLEVDHSHETGATSALLCGSCNKAFGLLKEDPSRIAALAAYALEWGTRA